MAISLEEICGNCGERYGYHHGCSCPDGVTTFKYSGNLCENNHEAIRYSSEKCPLCEQIKEYDILEKTTTGLAEDFEKYVEEHK